MPVGNQRYSLQTARWATLANQSYLHLKTIGNDGYSGAGLKLALVSKNCQYVNNIWKMEASGRQRAPTSTEGVLWPSTTRKVRGWYADLGWAIFGQIRKRGNLSATRLINVHVRPLCASFCLDRAPIDIYSFEHSFIDSTYLHICDLPPARRMREVLTKSWTRPGGVTHDNICRRRSPAPCAG